MTALPPLPQSTRERMRDEFARQHDILAREVWQRITLSCFGFALCSLYVNPPLIIALAAMDIAAELLSLRLVRGLDPMASPGRYRAVVGLLILMEASFAGAAGFVWLVEDPYAKALSAGLYMTTLLQLSTVRSIHLRLGLAGIGTVAAVAFLFNLAHWVAEGDWFGFAVTTAAAAAAVTYAVIAMLANYQLHRSASEAATAAQASDAAKGRFLAQMSHELRTPLNAIIGLGEVEAASAQGLSRERMETLVTSARGLAVVLDDVLDLSAITDGRVAISPRPVDLRAELKATLAIFDPQVEVLGVALGLTVAPDLPGHLYLDPQRLRQCLVNLISNAVKHGGGKEVRVTAAWTDGRLAIEVADDGAGIPPDLVEAVFEPFHRGSTTAPGIGLGLAISRSLARQMRGDLVLAPSERGAAFRLALDAPAASPPVQAARLDLAGCTVLVVDDIATNRLVAASLLKAIGAQVIEAASGPEALKLAGAGGIDLVLLDMTMPGMDGFETFHRLRAVPQRFIPVVAMTADVMPAKRAAVMAAGLDGFLPKPLLPETVVEVLGPVLAQAQAENRQAGAEPGVTTG